MNRRDMKKQVYRELANFLGKRSRQWSSIPNFFAELDLFTFREAEATQAEEDRLQSVISEMIIEFYYKSGLQRK